MLVVTCPACGFRNRSGIEVHGGMTLELRDIRIPCAQCGTVFTIPDGRYNFIGSTLEAFQKASRADLERYRAVVTAAARGEVSRSEAEAQAVQIHAAFGSLLKTAFQLGIPSLLVAIIALYLQWESSQAADRSEAALMRELQAQHHTNEQILSELKRLGEIQSTPPLQRYSQPTTPTEPSETRQQRRARERTEAKKPSRPL